MSSSSTWRSIENIRGRRNGFRPGWLPTRLRLVLEYRSSPPASARRRFSACGGDAALDRFKAINSDIITLSRRNSDVRSLASTLGRKRALTARCEDRLRALDEALERRALTPTR
jgi:hypothetical protein